MEAVGAEIQVSQVGQPSKLLAQLARHAVRRQRERLQLGHREELVGDLPGEEVIRHVKVQQLVELCERGEVEFAPARDVVQVQVQLRDPAAGAHDAVPVVGARLAHPPVTLHAPPHSIALLVKLLERYFIGTRRDQRVPFVRRGGHDHRGAVLGESPWAGLRSADADAAAPRVPPRVAPAHSLARLRIDVGVGFLFELLHHLLRGVVAGVDLLLDRRRRHDRTRVSSVHVREHRRLGGVVRIDRFDTSLGLLCHLVAGGTVRVDLRLVALRAVVVVARASLVRVALGDAGALRVVVSFPFELAIAKVCVGFSRLRGHAIGELVP